MQSIKQLCLVESEAKFQNKGIQNYVNYLNVSDIDFAETVTKKYFAFILDLVSSGLI